MVAQRVTGEVKVLSDLNTVGLIIKAAPSQAANIQEWQTSTGTVGFRVKANPQTIGFDAATTARIDVGSVSTMTYNASTGWLFTPYNTTSVGLTVKAAASQAVNLQEWQNSAGTPVTKINSAGDLLLTNIYDLANAGTGAYLNMTSTSAKLTARSDAVVLIIKGSSGQATSLQQWQDSGGTTVANVTPNGVGQFASVTLNTGYVLLDGENSGGFIRLTKQTAQAANSVSGRAKIYLRDGTNAGTLKLVIIAGASGAETTILDNIPQ